MVPERECLGEEKRVGNIFTEKLAEVIQFYVDGKTDDQVMDALSVSYGALAVRNTRIRKKIKGYFQDRGVVLVTNREMMVRTIITSIANNWVSTDNVNRELESPLSEDEKLLINLMLKLGSEGQIKKELRLSGVKLNVMQKNILDILTKLGAKTFYGAVATLTVLTLEGKKPY